MTRNLGWGSSHIMRFLPAVGMTGIAAGVTDRTVGMTLFATSVEKGAWPTFREAGTGDDMARYSAS